MTTLEKLAIGTTGIAGLKLLIGGAVLEWGGRKVGLGSPDSGAIAAVLGPVLAAYAASLHRSMRDDNHDGIPDDREGK